MNKNDILDAIQWWEKEIAYLSNKVADYLSQGTESWIVELVKIDLDYTVNRVTSLKNLV